nr:hypothetical protein Iba_chr12dCG10890 [Ipomoea batatas]
MVVLIPLKLLQFNNSKAIATDTFFQYNSHYFPSNTRKYLNKATAIQTTTTHPLVISPLSLYPLPKHVTTTTKKVTMHTKLLQICTNKHKKNLNLLVAGVPIDALEPGACISL